MSAWLITRPLEDSKALASFIVALGGTAFVEPLTAISTVQHSLNWAGVTHAIVTSKHAHPALSTCPHTVTIYRLGVNGRTVADLLQSFQKNVSPHNARVLYICGRDTTIDVVSYLRQRGYAAEGSIVYEAVERTEFSQELCHAVRNNGIKGVCFFSMRSAQIFMDLWAKSGLHSYEMALKAVTISTNVADLLLSMQWQKIYISEYPSLLSMHNVLKEVV